MGRPFRIVVGHSFKTLVAEPFFLLVHLFTLVALALLAALPGFTRGEHARLLRDQSQALLFLVGCLLVCFGLIRVITDDLRQGAGSILAKQPTGPLRLTVAKWLGAIGGIILLHLSGLAGSSWANYAGSEPEHLKIGVMVTYLVVVLLAIGVAGLAHYLFRMPFTLVANSTLAVGMLLGLALQVPFANEPGIDWAAWQSGLFLGLGLVTFSAFVLPVAVLFESALVLGCGAILFCAGLISSHLVRQWAPGEAIARLAGALVPDWQRFWVADRLASGEVVPLAYLGNCALYALATTAFFAVVAARLLERREVPR